MNISKKYVALSILGHFIILAIIFLQNFGYVSRDRDPHLGVDYSIMKAIILSQVPHNNVMKTNLRPESKSAPLKQIHQIPRKIRPHYSTSLKHKQNISQLLQIIHKAIANRQQYPETAMELDQKGTVTIGFNMHPDGLLTNIYLLKSSGSSILDKAALQTVEQISPIKTAGYQPDNIGFYSVDIIFK